ncbi:alanine racemase [Thioflexithrix psekupsensis]|uniref:Alanine racemase n=1 Tax=Thioflexithrix psekupsensis TaxID=1570016 RepID=A0A251X465_9GAMM|nr:alanine racemase [Thioflexithrix psekupsensis]OUD12180.1 alanine racemase [Thioflexithrix psekupsensis]
MNKNVFRPTIATIHLDAILHNYQLIQSLAPNSRIVAVVKANAYGHGAWPVARHLAAQAEAFAVACLEEALQLRQTGISQPIVLLEGFFSARELPLIAHHHFIPVFHHHAQIEQLYSSNVSQPMDAWIKMDSGMHRLGFAPEKYAAACQRVHDHPCIRSLVAMTHLACADNPDHDFTTQQLAVFTRYNPLKIKSISNSAGIFTGAESHQEWVRPGIALYGGLPLLAPNEKTEKLRPAMCLSSKIIAIQEVKAGDRIGYGGDFLCQRNTKAGVVAIGYADGYPRHAPTGTPVWVAGRRVPLIGRVSMDMISVDLTDHPSAILGDEVELWGQHLSVNEVAACCKTISYDLLTGVTGRVVFHYSS